MSGKWTGANVLILRSDLAGECTEMLSATTTTTTTTATATAGHLPSVSRETG